jgi:hypothetical protein
MSYKMLRQSNDFKQAHTTFTLATLSRITNVRKCMNIWTLENKEIILHQTLNLS